MIEVEINDPNDGVEAEFGSSNITVVAVNPKGTWDNEETYVKGDMVYNAGNSYVAKKAVPAGTSTSNTEYWQIVADVPTDTTLTQTGEAADAKATGDAIAAVAATVPEVDGSLTQAGEAADAKVTGDEIAALKAGTSLADGSITEAKLANALKLKTINSYVTPEMYGAVGDGVTDDTAAIQAAIDSGKTVCFKENYLISDTINVNRSGQSLIGASKNASIVLGAALKTSANESDWGLLVDTSESWIIKTITLPVSKGAKTITIDSAAGISAGMLVQIKGDFTTSPWTSDNRGEIVKGEINIVSRVSGTTIELAFPVSDKWDASETVVLQFIEPAKNISIKGLNILASSSASEDSRPYRGIRISNAVNCELVDCTIKHCGMMSAELYSSVNSRIMNCYVEDGWGYNEGTSTLQLGYALRDTQGNCNMIINNVVNGARHAVDVSGVYPAHRTLISQNTFSSPADSNIVLVNTHGSAEGTIFHQNIINGRTNLSGENILFEGNRCEAGVQTSSGRNFIFKNNLMYRSAFTIKPPDINESGNYIVFDGNTIIQTMMAYISSAGETPYDAVYGLVAINNLIINNTSSSSGYLFNISSSGSDTLTLKSGLIISNNFYQHLAGSKAYVPSIISDMSKVTMGASKWEGKVLSNKFVGAGNAPTPMIGTESYLTDSHKLQIYDGSAWRDTDGNAIT